MKTTIRWKASEIVPFADIVRKRADSEREALGFLPERVYREAAEQEKLLIAFTSLDVTEKYAGHLLFGGVFPHGRIFQLYVDPSYRCNGIGTKLIQEIVRKSEASNYLSIKAKVAADLYKANEFWDSMQFFTVQTKTGGTSRGRSINIRVRDLNTPNLLGRELIKA